MRNASNRESGDGDFVVFTNGVFDLFHKGHEEFLRRASELGTFLLVGVTSDQSNLQKRRSMEDWETRSARVLQSPHVDAVIETPWSKDLTPYFYSSYGINLHVQGDDGSDFGPARELGIFKSIGRTPNISTSMIIEILQSASKVSLEGGDVNEVFRVTFEERDYILKRARNQIAKNYDFIPPPYRIRDEYDALVAFRDALQNPGFIADPVWTDSKDLLILNAAPVDAQPLGEMLANGVFSNQMLTNIVRSLAKMHSATRSDSNLRRRFGNTRGFREIKLGLQCLQASTKPDLLNGIEALLEESSKVDQALLHGDFAPKNIMVFGDDFMFIDFEESGYWDPALDIGYLLAHLLIQAFNTAQVSCQSELLSHCLGNLFQSYAVSVGTLDSDFESRLGRYIGLFVLSRLDSPAPDPKIPLALKQILRSVGSEMLMSQVPLDDVLERYFN